MFVIIAATLCSTSDMLGGSWDLVSKVISTLIGVISTVTLIITLVTKSHDPLSAVFVVFITVKKTLALVLAQGRTGIQHTPNAELNHTFIVYW